MWVSSVNMGNFVLTLKLNAIKFFYSKGKQHVGKGVCYWELGSIAFSPNHDDLVQYFIFIFFWADCLTRMHIYLLFVMKYIGVASYYLSECGLIS